MIRVLPSACGCSVVVLTDAETYLRCPHCLAMNHYQRADHAA
jgi:uncharacterized C2H2 Zn-finger protein